MPWNGAGTFNREYSWVADAAAGIDISSTRMDADTDDITGNGLGNCLTRDGQGIATANLPMNGFRHTGVANGVARTDYAALGQMLDGTVQKIPTIGDLATFPTTNLANGQIVLVAGYASAGDGGGGVFLVTTTNPGADNGGTIIHSSTSGFYFVRQFNGPINVAWFGAVSDKATPARAAIQAAIAAQIALGGGGVVIQGQYLIDSTTSPDALAYGIVIPYSNGATPIALICNPATELLAGSNNMIICRLSDSSCIISGSPQLIANGMTGVWGLGIVPADMTQTTAVVNQNYNNFDVVPIDCAEGVVLQAGPDVSTVDSGCWFNRGVINTFGCLRSAWLKNPTNTTGSYVTKGNLSIDVHNIGGTVNTGLQIDAGSANNFYCCSFEGVNGGTSPNAIPTAVKIAMATAGGANNDGNRFFGLDFEANTRDVDLANNLTEFYGWNPSGAKVLFTAAPAISISSAPSEVPLSVPGLIFQGNNTLAGVPDNVSYFEKGAVVDGNGLQVWRRSEVSSGPGGGGTVINFDFALPYVELAQYQIIGGFFENIATPTFTGRTQTLVCETTAAVFVIDQTAFNVSTGSPTTFTAVVTRPDLGTLRVTVSVATGGSNDCLQYASVIRTA